MVVLDRHFARKGLCETPEISYQAAIEGQEKRPAMVVRFRMGQVTSAVYRHRGFAAAGSTQHDDMAMRRQAKDLPLAANRLRQAHGFGCPPRKYSFAAATWRSRFRIMGLNPRCFPGAEEKPSL
jgi:hypothetical protein